MYWKAIVLRNLINKFPQKGWLLHSLNYLLKNCKKLAQQIDNFWHRERIWKKTVSKLSTSPNECHYTTLWNTAYVKLFIITIVQALIVMINWQLRTNSKTHHNKCSKCLPLALTRAVPGSGTPCTSRTAENVDAVNDLALSQEGAPGTHETTRQIAMETGILQRSVGASFTETFSESAWKNDWSMVEKLTEHHWSSN